MTTKYTENCQFLRYYRKIHSKLPIFRIKSVKNYTGQKKLHKYIRGVRDKYEVCQHLPGVGGRQREDARSWREDSGWEGEGGCQGQRGGGCERGRCGGGDEDDDGVLDDHDVEIGKAVKEVAALLWSCL